MMTVFAEREIAIVARNLVGTVRGSSWGKLYDCSLSWYYSNVVGLRSPSSGAAGSGTAIHAGAAVFDIARMNGEPGDIEAAVDEALNVLHHPDDDIAWIDRSEQKAAEQMVIKLTTAYCLKIAPTREYVGVEMKCEPMEIQTRHGVIKTTGTLDRVRLVPNVGLGVSDIKSGKRATSLRNGVRVATTTTHHLQLGIYTIMAEHASGQTMDAPSEIIGLQTTKEGYVATSELPDCKTALLGTDEAPGMIDMAAKMLKEGFFPPNPKSVLCTKRYCDGWSRCPYKSQD